MPSMPEPHDRGDGGRHDEFAPSETIDTSSKWKASSGPVATVAAAVIASASATGRGRPWRTPASRIPGANDSSPTTAANESCHPGSSAAAGFAPASPPPPARARTSATPDGRRARRRGRQCPSRRRAGSTARRPRGERRPRRRAWRRRVAAGAARRPSPRRRARACTAAARSARSPRAGAPARIARRPSASLRGSPRPDRAPCRARAPPPAAPGRLRAPATPVSDGVQRAPQPPRRRPVEDQRSTITAAWAPRRAGTGRRGPSAATRPSTRTTVPTSAPGGALPSSERSTASSPRTRPASAAPSSIGRRGADDPRAHRHAAVRPDANGLEQHGLRGDRRADRRRQPPRPERVGARLGEERCGEHRGDRARGRAARGPRGAPQPRRAAARAGARAAPRAARRRPRRGQGGADGGVSLRSRPAAQRGRPRWCAARPSSHPHQLTELCHADLTDARHVRELLHRAEPAALSRWSRMRLRQPGADAGRTSSCSSVAVLRLTGCTAAAAAGPAPGVVGPADAAAPCGTRSGTRI